MYKGLDGYLAKYVVFIPHAYDGKRSFPGILYLHGAGSSGTDGRKQIRGALAEAIRKREQTFEFVTVFPQYHGKQGWLAESADGKRVIAILDDVARDYQVDTKRVYLTGVSAGGHGTWSLAAAHPKRWAAIVPICHGGDTSTAAEIKHIPCCCFHGDADWIISVQKLREMIRAIKNTGGRPPYHEYPGVGHNCWDRAYGNPDLYEWLLLQSRP